MGELHLEIYVERIRREYKRRGRGRRAEGQLPRGPHAGRPSSTPGTRSRPAARASTPTSSAAWTSLPEDAAETFVFEDEVIGGRIPKQFIPAVEKGFRQMLHKGPVAGYPGGRPEGHRSKTARTTRWTAPTWRSRSAPGPACARTSPRTRPVLLEPVMKIEIECPDRVPGLGGGQSDLPPRHGRGHRSQTAPICRIEGEVPLAETFGYSTDLRSMTPGPGHVHDGVRQAIAACRRASSGRSSPPENCKWPRFENREVFPWLSAATIPGRNSRLSRKMRWKRS